MSQLALSLIAGSLSSFSPCVLPTFPLIAGGSLQTHRWGPVAMALGMVAAFSTTAMLLHSTGSILGLDPDIARYISASMMIAFGAILVSTRLKAGSSIFTSAFAAKANNFLRQHTPSGLKGQFLVGSLLGAVWMPCSGPIFGAAMTMAATGDDMMTAAAMMGLFGVGASVPLLLVAYGSKRLLYGSRFVTFATKHGQLVFGIILLAFGAMVLSGMDKYLEAQAVAHVPSWLIDLTTKF